MPFPQTDTGGEGSQLPAKDQPAEVTRYLKTEPVEGVSAAGGAEHVGPLQAAGGGQTDATRPLADLLRLQSLDGTVLRAVHAAGGRQTRVRARRAATARSMTQQYLVLMAKTNLPNVNQTI